MSFSPKKYYRGLSRKNQTRRKKEIAYHSRIDFKNPRAYTRFKTDSIIPTRPSSYTSVSYTHLTLPTICSV